MRRNIATAHGGVGLPAAVEPDDGQRGKTHPPDKAAICAEGDHEAAGAADENGQQIGAPEPAVNVDHLVSNSADKLKTTQQQSDTGTDEVKPGEQWLAAEAYLKVRITSHAKLKREGVKCDRQRQCDQENDQVGVTASRHLPIHP